jgi:MFS family permease
LLGSDILLAVLQLAVALILLTGTGRVWMLLAASVVYGAGAAVFRPALTGIVPETVSVGRLQQANALIGMSQSAALVVGPVVAGLLVVAVGPGWVYVVDAMTYLVSAACLARLRVPAVKRATGEGFWRQLAGGWREVVARRWYWQGLIAHAVWSFAVTPFFVLGPVLVGASAWGLVSAAGAAGALAGGLVALRWRPHRPLVAGHLVLLFGAGHLLALAFSLPAVVVALAAALSMLGMTVLNQLWTTTMQRLVPEALMSRVSSYDWLVSLVATPVGFALAGPVAQTAGSDQVLVGAALLVVLACALVVSAPSVRGLVLRAADEATTATADGGEAAVGAEVVPAPPGGH